MFKIDKVSHSGSPSSMEGLFAVDRWTSRKNKAFFLTHMHGDHTKGLSERWQHGPLYCSRITAALLLLKFPAFDRSLIHVLPLGTPSLIPLPEHQLLEVTPIDADHCPGSVMFVFRGAFGCILHTGDFRWELGSPKLDATKRCIAAAMGGSRVDLLCLDNTFCNACFSFPPRHVAAQKVVDIIASHEAYDVLVGIDMLGKEELLISIAKALKTKIWIWPERLQTMRLLGISDFFITDTTATRIRAVPRYSISHETLRMLNEIKPTIAVLPSGLWCLCKAFTFDSCLDGTLGTSKSESCFGNKHAKTKVEHGFLKSSKTHINGGEDEYCQVKPAIGQDIFCVSYSLHSCFSELKEFVEFVKPTSVKGNLRSSHVNINPCQTLHQTCCIKEETSKQFSRFDEKGSTMGMLQHDGSMQCCDIVNEDGIHRKDMDIHTSVLEHDVTLHCCHIVNENDTHASKDNCFCRKVKGRKRLRKASYMRAQRAWAMLRKRRGGGAFVGSET